MRRPTPFQILLFAYVWLMVGFATGTLVLLGPARWVTSAMATPGMERAAMLLVILLYVAASFLLALWLTRVLILRHPSRAVKAVAVTVVTGSAALALWGWRNPVVYASVAGGETVQQRMVTESGSEFLFGPYPDRERLAELKKEGVTAVVSLQHPAVVPFEPEGIARGKEWTKELGIEFIHAPMLPWVSDNRASLERIRALVREGGGGTYYVHCGLGRDRVSVVQRLIERMGGRVASSEGTEEALTWGDREAEGLGDLERGPARLLEEGVWLVPYPNEHEMFGHMLAGQVAHALLVLDPDDARQGEWLEEGRGLLGAYDVPHSTARPPTTAAEAASLAGRARDLPRPLTIVVPFTAADRDTGVADAISAAWAGDPSTKNQNTEGQP